MTEKILVNRVLEIMREKQSYRYKYGLGKSEFDKLIRQVANLTLQMLEEKQGEKICKLTKKEQENFKSFFKGWLLISFEEKEELKE